MHGEKNKKETSNETTYLLSQDKDIASTSNNDGSLQPCTELPSITPSPKWWHIDQRMIISKTLFFIDDSAEVIVISYIIVFLTSIGLSVKGAGAISGTALALAFLASPLLGYLADCTGSKKLVFMILCIGSCVSWFPLPYIAASLRKIGTKSIDDIAVPFQSTLFFVMLALVSLAQVFINAIRGFTVAFVMAIVKKSPWSEFGMQALYGGVGVMISSAIAGISLDHKIRHSSQILSEYTPIFYFVFILSLIMIPLGMMAASQAKSESSDDNKRVTTMQRFKLIRDVCTIPNIIFMISVVVAGICNNAIGSFLFQIMKDRMNSSNMAMGFARTFAGIGEVVVFIYAKKCVNILRGPMNCIIISILSFSLRFLLVAFIRNPWWVLPTQLIHGISFALFWVAAAEYTYCFANEEIYTTVFSFITSLYYTLGGVLGLTVAGVVYNVLGGYQMFLCVSGFSAVWAVVMVIYFYGFKVLRREEKAVVEVESNVNEGFDKA